MYKAKSDIEKLAANIISEILDVGLAESTWRESNPFAYEEIRKYRAEMEVDAVKHLSNADPVPPYLHTAVALLERLVQQVRPGLDPQLVDLTYNFLKKYPLKNSYAEQYENSDVQERGITRSVFARELNVGKKEADKTIERIQTLYETGDVLVLTGKDLGKLAQMLWEMDRHLPDFFEDDSNEEE